MKILVTGAAGFLGWNLCRRLLAEGHEVVGLDNYQTGLESNIHDLEYAAELAGAGFAFRRYDIGFVPLRLGFGNAFPSGPAAPDRIYHLACPASPKFYQQDPYRTFQTAIEGTDFALSMARHYGKSPRVLLASTSEVYGDPLVPVQAESYRGNVATMGPRACYDEGKRAAETLADIYHRYGVDVRVARIFNTYGPGMRQDDGRAIPAFVAAALEGRPLTVYGGAQTRSFCYVDDLIEGLVRVMEADDGDLAGALGEQRKSFPPTFNLGNPKEEREIVSLARAVLRAGFRSGANTARQVRRLDHLWDIHDPRRRCPDISRARKLGWEPSVGLDEGLERMVAWALKNWRLQ